MGTACGNDRQAYIHKVLMLSGLGGQENLPQPSRGTFIDKLKKLLVAMEVVECGIPFQKVDVVSIRKRYRMAFPGKRSYARTKPVEPDSDAGEMEDLLVWDEYRDW